jgi:DNA-binding transcriptional MerR regulator
VIAYTLGDVARICGVSRRRLRYWERTALLDPSPADPRQPAFDFRALVSVRSIVGLLSNGVSLRTIRRSVETVRARVPDVEALRSLRLFEATERIVFRHEGLLMEPDGQLVLDFGGRDAGAGVEPLARHLDPVEARARADAWFETGCGIDGESSSYERAAQAYRRAIEIDPEHADAWCNLGSVYFNQGRRPLARDCFERVLVLVPGHVEANLNLGTIREEEGRDQSALRHYRAAFESDPLFGDTHVSLALVYEKLDASRRALDHWRRYLQLEPAGAWSEIARHRLTSH